MDDQQGTWLVKLAEKGHRRALDQLVELYLPLVYNILGHALIGSAVTEDEVEQLALQTTARVVDDFDGLPDRTRMRAWFAVAAVERVRELRDAPRSLPGGTGAHSADFVDVTVARLKLSGQRQEIAEATRWLGADDREVLSLWWLEETGVLTRGDLETALGLTAHQADARIWQLREALDAARRVVRVLKAGPPCADLVLARVGWDGRPDPDWRESLHRHLRTCARCTRGIRLAPAGLLLAGLAPVPPPTVSPSPDAHGLVVDHVGESVAGARGWNARPPGPAHARRTRTRTFRRYTPLASMHWVAVVAAVASIATAVATVALEHDDPAPPTAAHATTPQTTSATAGRRPTLLPAPDAPLADAARLSIRPSPPAPTGPTYGGNVDGTEPAPPNLQWPANLPARPTGPDVTAVGGTFQLIYPGTADVWKITSWGDTIVLRGTGYFAVLWGIFPSDGVAPVVMPTWTGLQGKLFHVASGGGHRMDDTRPPGRGVQPGATWMGQPSTGFCTLPAGAQQMWQSEYYYLDGEVVLHNNETGMDYDLALTPMTIDDVRADLTTPPTPTRGSPSSSDRVRYGVARDTGDDSAPVPQYLTRDQPSDQSTVPQHSHVT